MPFKKGEFLLEQFKEASRNFYSYEEGSSDEDLDQLEAEFERTLKELEDYIKGG